MKKNFLEYIESFLSDQIRSFGGNEKYSLVLRSNDKFQILNEQKSQECIFELEIKNYYEDKISDGICFEFIINNNIFISKIINPQYFNENNSKHYLTEVKLFANNSLKENINKK